jgi:hypothetical protein
LREAMGFNGRGGQQKFADFLGVERGRTMSSAVLCSARKWRCGSSANSRE